MKIIFAVFVLTFSVNAGERIPFRDTCSINIIDYWKQQPVVPLPNFDHQVLLHGAGAFAVYFGQVAFGTRSTKAALITSGLALTFEAAQVLLFDETLKHSAQDLVMFSFHWSRHLMLEREYVGAAVVTINLVGVYLVLLPCR